RGAASGALARGTVLGHEDPERRQALVPAAGGIRPVQPPAPRRRSPGLPGNRVPPERKPGREYGHGIGLHRSMGRPEAGARARHIGVIAGYVGGRRCGPGASPGPLVVDASEALRTAVGWPWAPRERYSPGLIVTCYPRWSCLCNVVLGR